jgi:hypothetical protein
MKKSDLIRMCYKRSFNTSFEVWDVIKSDFILYCGLLEKPYFYFHIDSSDIYKSISNESKTVSFSDESSFDFNSDLLSKTSLSYEINICINTKSKNYSSYINDSVYYFLEDKEYYDDGAIHTVYEGDVSIENIEKFELEFLLELAKETRHAWFKTVQEVNISSKAYKDFIEEDIALEKIFVIAKLKKLELEDALRLYAEDLRFSDRQIRNLNKKINSGIVWEI